MSTSAIATAPTEVFESPAMALKRAQQAVHVDAERAKHSVLERFRALADEAAALADIDNMYDRREREGLSKLASNTRALIDSFGKRTLTS